MDRNDQCIRQTRIEKKHASLQNPQKCCVNNPDNYLYFRATNSVLVFPRIWKVRQGFSLICCHGCVRKTLAKYSNIIRSDSMPGIQDLQRYLLVLLLSMAVETYSYQ